MILLHVLLYFELYDVSMATLCWCQLHFFFKVLIAKRTQFPLKRYTCNFVIVFNFFAFIVCIFGPGLDHKLFQPIGLDTDLAHST